MQSTGTFRGLSLDPTRPALPRGRLADGVEGHGRDDEKRGGDPAGDDGGGNLFFEAGAAGAGDRPSEGGGPGAERTAGPLAVRIEGARAAVWASVIDGAANLASSSRILLAHLTDECAASGGGSMGVFPEPPSSSGMTIGG